MDTFCIHSKAGMDKPIPYSANFWWRKFLADLVNHWWFTKSYRPNLTMSRDIYKENIQARIHRSFPPPKICAIQYLPCSANSFKKYCIHIPQNVTADGSLQSHT